MQVSGEEVVEDEQLKGRADGAGRGADGDEGNTKREEGEGGEGEERNARRWRGGGGDEANRADKDERETGR